MTQFLLLVLLGAVVLGFVSYTRGTWPNVLKELAT